MLHWSILVLAAYGFIATIAITFVWQKDFTRTVAFLLLSPVIGPLILIVTAVLLPKVIHNLWIDHPSSDDKRSASGA